ncbi:MAG: cell division protein ZapA [Elusimicrobia bacterium]|nr:cell division protein ZapA [Elusimicrobiota bacterium]
MNEKIPVIIAGLHLEVEVEGLLQMEVSSIANLVNDKLEEVKALYPNVVDTRRLAVYTALYVAIDLYKLQQAESTNRKATENTLDHIDKTLQQTLKAAGVEAE